MSENQEKKRRRRRLTVPREEIAWYPVIDPDLCNNCRSCLQYCPKSVFASSKPVPQEGRRAKMMVVQPYECIVLCSACQKICASGAISFPLREDFERFVEYLD